MFQNLQISVIHHINKLKNKGYIISSIDAENIIWQNPTSIYD